MILDFFIIPDVVILETIHSFFPKVVEANALSAGAVSEALHSMQFLMYYLFLTEQTTHTVT